MVLYKDFLFVHQRLLDLINRQHGTQVIDMELRGVVESWIMRSCLLSFKTNKQTNKSRFSWCRRTGAREAVLLFTRRCWQPLRNLFPHSLHYGTMFATNWSSNGGLAAEDIKVMNAEVFAKNLEKCSLLTNLLGRNVEILDDYGCPKIQDLVKTESSWICSSYPFRHKTRLHCAERKAKVYGEWAT